MTHDRMEWGASLEDMVGMTQGKKGTTAHKKGKRHHRPSKRNQMVLLRWVGLIAAMLIIVLIVVRCATGSKGTTAEKVAVDETASRVEFSKKGAVTVTSVESFDKDYYDETELQEMIDSQVAAYGDGVSAGSLTVADGTATLVMKYDSAADYTSFNDQVMFWGTLQEAETAGYDLSGFTGMVNAQDSEQSFNEETKAALAENTVIVITEPLNVLTPTNILYASESLTIAGSDYATVNGDISETSPAILILQ